MLTGQIKAPTFISLKLNSKYRMQIRRSDTHTYTKSILFLAPQMVTNCIYYS